MRSLAKLVYAAPDSLRTRLGRNLPEAAKAIQAVSDKVLGVQGSEHDRSRPGEPPRRQTGELQRATRAVPAASKLEISILTSDVGAMLNLGTSRTKQRGFLATIVRLSAPAVREALQRK